MLLLGGEAGLRCGEMIGLEWSDVDFKRAQIKVERSEWQGVVGAPKSGRSRIVPMTARLVAALKAIKHLVGPRVLYGDGRKQVTRDVLWVWMKKVQLRAGLEVTGALHILRHTFCSRLAMKGASTRAIQELAGHQNITTTQRYMHLTPAARDEAIMLLEPGVGAEKFGDMLETAPAAEAK